MIPSEVQRDTDRGMTRGEALLLIFLVILSVWLVWTFTVPTERDSPAPSGVIGSVIGSLGRTMILGGGAFVFSSDTRTVDSVPLVIHEGIPPSTAGPALLIGVQLPVGYLSAIPMSTCTLTVKNRTATETLRYTQDRPLPRAGWTISGQKNLPPFNSADTDLLLEPQEQFNLVINPSLVFHPGESIIITLQPDKGFPLVVSGQVPVKLSAVNPVG